MNKLLVSASVALGATSLSFAQQTEKPNFLLFIADDCSHYDLGCYGSVDSKTPNIDRFATQGVRFTQAYQAVPMSSPTRHNLYTGLWPVRSGAYPNHTCANEGTLSVVHHLQPLGYKVALIGKSHIAPKSVFPFDLYVPPLKGGDLNFEAIQKFISDCKAKGEPFCLFVASNQPHTPWNKGDASQFNADKLTLPPMYVDIPQTRELFTHYLAEINYMDQEFGNVLSILDQEKMTDKSVVVYLSEQGNSLPFAKWTCYDAGLQTGFIVRWKGVTMPGSETDAMCEYVDVTPTLLDIAGASVPKGLDGKSFLPVIKGKKTNKEYVFGIQTTRGIANGADYYGIRSVRNDKFSYILNLTPEVPFQNIITRKQDPVWFSWINEAENDIFAKQQIHKYQYRPKEELYDIINDPYQMHNLIDDVKYASEVKKLRRQLQRWMDSQGDKGQETEMRALEHKWNPKKH